MISVFVWKKFIVFSSCYCSKSETNIVKLKVNDILINDSILLLEEDYLQNILWKPRAKKIQ